MDSRYTEDMSIPQQKMLQYDVIAEEFEPVIFRNAPYYFETGVLTSLSDGARISKNHEHMQANGWVYDRNSHFLWEQEENLVKRRKAQGEEQLYLICGAFNDDMQHFGFNNRPILENGLHGIYEKAQNELKNANNSNEFIFDQTVYTIKL